MCRSSSPLGDNDTVEYSGGKCKDGIHWLELQGSTKMASGEKGGEMKRKKRIKNKGEREIKGKKRKGGQRGGRWSPHIPHTHTLALARQRESMNMLPTRLQSWRVF